MAEFFSDPENTDEYGIVCFGNNLSPNTLVEAYSKGIFPWPIQDFPMIPWFCPPERGVLFFENLHVSKSLRRAKNQSKLKFTIDQDFKRVIRECAAVPRRLPDGTREDTWISTDIIKAYETLHLLGHAHSIEAWNKDQLVGGLYGMCVSGVFAGESMFHHETNASKLALLFLIENLMQKNATFMDTQMVTPVTESFGAQLVSRKLFLDYLKKEQSRKLTLF